MSFNSSIALILALNLPSAEPKKEEEGEGGGRGGGGDQPKGAKAGKNG